MTKSVGTPTEQYVIDKGIPFTFGQDTTRIWATAAQSFINEEFTLIVLREAIQVDNEITGVKEQHVKNVGSFALPTSILRIFLESSLDALNLLESDNGRQEDKAGPIG